MRIGKLAKNLKRIAFVSAWITVLLFFRFFCLDFLGKSMTYGQVKNNLHAMGKLGREVYRFQMSNGYPPPVSSGLAKDLEPFLRPEGLDHDSTAEFSASDWWGNPLEYYLIEENGIQSFQIISRGQGGIPDQGKFEPFPLSTTKISTRCTESDTVWQGSGFVQAISGKHKSCDPSFWEILTGLPSRR